MFRVFEKNVIKTKACISVPFEDEINHFSRTKTLGGGGGRGKLKMKVKDQKSKMLS